MSLKFRISFYKTPQGKKIVEEYIKKQHSRTKAKIINTLDFLKEYGFDLLGTHWMKKIHNRPDLYELRVKNINEYRFILCFKDGSFTILSGFEKKKQKIPKKEIDLSIRRYKENTT